MKRQFVVLVILVSLLIGSNGLAAPATAGRADGPGPVRYGLGGKISLKPPPGDWNAIPAACQPIVLQVFNWVGLPAFDSDVCVSGSTGGGNETTIVADPTRPTYFVAGANANGTGHYTTTNGGLTWTGGAFSGIGDPTATYDGAGNAYFGELTSYNCPDPLRVHKSTNGGVTWDGGVIAMTDPSPTDHFLDKEWLTADTWATSPYYGRVYLAATSFHTPPGCDLGNYIDNREVLTFSSDGGTTWSAPATISDPAHNQNQFVNPVVAPNGRVYVSFQYQNCTYSCNGVPASNMIVHSDDGGVNWTPPITITGAPISYTGASVAGYQNLYASSTTSGFRHNDQSILGVSPANPNVVYSVWTDGRWDSTFVFQSVTGRHADIAFSRSTDGGVTWTPALRINDDTAGNGRDQYFPWMVVGADGTIHVSWSDRRDGNSFQYGVYYTQSSDGGLTWATNRKVTDVLATPGSFMGDYSGIAVNADNTLVLPIWTDMRSGQQAYFDRGLLRMAHPQLLPAGLFYNTGP